MAQGGFVGHAGFLQDAAGGQVAGHVVGFDPVEWQIAESEVDDRPADGGGESLAGVGPQDGVGDLGAGGGRFEWQVDSAGGVAFEFDGPAGVDGAVGGEPGGEELDGVARFVGLPDGGQVAGPLGVGGISQHIVGVVESPGPQPAQAVFLCQRMRFGGGLPGALAARVTGSGQRDPNFAG